jgi:hypothetical protein
LALRSKRRTGRTRAGTSDYHPFIERSKQEKAMAKGPTAHIAGEHAREFDQNAERAMQAANYGIDWMRDLAEQTLNQSKAVFEGFLTTARSSGDTIDQQAGDIRERSLALAAETMSNSFEYAQRFLHVREPQEVLQLQSEFLGRQAQALADQAKHLGHTFAQAANQNARTAAGQMQSAMESSRRKAES